MIVGGLRARLIRDNFRIMVHDALDEKGWLDTEGRQHQRINVIVAPATWDDPVEINSIAVSALDVGSLDDEMGSNLTEDTWTFYTDFFAESETLGLEVIHDIRDILRGKMPSVGRTRPILEVLDLRLAEPVALFVCQIEDVVVDRAANFPKPWQKYWFSARCDVVDTYGDESDDD